MSLNDYPVEAYERAINELQQFDFDTVIAGHGDIIGEKADLALFLGWLQALDAGVAAGIAEAAAVPRTS